MKSYYCLILGALLAGCGQRPFKRGAAEFIHYRTGPATSTLLAGDDYKGHSSATETLRYRNPHVALYEDFVVISYPGSSMKDRVIPRESLIELQWK